MEKTGFCDVGVGLDNFFTYIHNLDLVSIQEIFPKKVKVQS